MSVPFSLSFLSFFFLFLVSVFLLQVSSSLVYFHVQLKMCFPSELSMLRVHQVHMYQTSVILDAAFMLLRYVFFFYNILDIFRSVVSHAAARSCFCLSLLIEVSLLSPSPVTSLLTSLCVLLVSPVLSNSCGHQTELEVYNILGYIFLDISTHATNNTTNSLVVSPFVSMVHLYMKYILLILITLFN